MAEQQIRCLGPPGALTASGPSSSWPNSGFGTNGSALTKAKKGASVQEVNRGKQIIPAIVFPDGSILVEPSNVELADKLGLQRQARRPYYSDHCGWRAGGAHGSHLRRQGGNQYADR